MATEPVNERPIFPALLQVSALGIGQWSTSMIRQLTTVFQQYGYRLNKALLDEDLSSNGGSIPQTNQAQTWTGVQTFTATQTLEAAAPEIRLSETDTTDDNWAIKADASLLKVEEQDDLFATTGTHTTLTHGGGMQVGSPTGGDKGAGAVNATGLFENGTGIAKLSGGADANFTAMPQVGGDPVVESGSNTDGEWTRWADGTQLCHKSDSTVLGAGSLTGGVYVSGGIEIFLAQAFIGQPHGSVGAGAGSATAGFWMTFVAAMDSSSGFARAYRNESFTTGDNGTFQVMAIGRWK